jgi:hypothetical protein
MPFGKYLDYLIHTRGLNDTSAAERTGINKDLLQRWTRPESDFLPRYDAVVKNGYMELIDLGLNLNEEERQRLRLSYAFSLLDKTVQLLNMSWEQVLLLAREAIKPRPGGVPGGRFHVGYATWQEEMRSLMKSCDSCLEPPIVPLTSRFVDIYYEYQDILRMWEKSIA